MKMTSNTVGRKSKTCKRWLRLGHLKSDDVESVYLLSSLSALSIEREIRKIGFRFLNLSLE